MGIDNRVIVDRSNLLKKQFLAWEYLLKRQGKLFIFLCSLILFHSLDHADFSPYITLYARLLNYFVASYVMSH